MARVQKTSGDCQRTYTIHRRARRSEPPALSRTLDHVSDRTRGSTIVCARANGLKLPPPNERKSVPGVKTLPSRRESSTANVRCAIDTHSRSHNDLNEVLTTFGDQDNHLNRTRCAFSLLSGESALFRFGVRLLSVKTDALEGTLASSCEPCRGICALFRVERSPLGADCGTTM